jgi:type II secretory pathway component PulM
MNAHWLTFKKQNWDSRSLQERRVIKFSAWALAPVLVYFILWQPAHTAVQKLHASVPVMSMEVERLRNQAGEVEMLRHRPKPALLDALAMKSTIEDSASRHNLRESISTLDLQQPNAVRITFSSVSFEQWLRWLKSMQQEQHIRADSVSVVMLPQTGMVKISATLINGGAQ